MDAAVGVMKLFSRIDGAEARRWSMRDVGDAFSASAAAASDLASSASATAFCRRRESADCGRLAVSRWRPGLSRRLGLKGPPADGGRSLVGLRSFFAGVCCGAPGDSKSGDTTIPPPVFDEAALGSGVLRLGSVATVDVTSTVVLTLFGVEAVAAALVASKRLARRVWLPEWACWVLLKSQGCHITYTSWSGSCTIKMVVMSI